LQGDSIDNDPNRKNYAPLDIDNPRVPLSEIPRLLDKMEREIQGIQNRRLRDPAAQYRLEAI